jgi:microcystin degradation protein MlrC
MRIAIAEFKQETNTFVHRPTEFAQFEDFHLYRGEEMLRAMRGTNCEVGGFIEVLEAHGHTILPTLAAFAISGGAVTRETYVALLNELLERLEAARPFDAVLLALHGAMVVEGDDDADSTTLQAVRNLVGEGTPVAVSMDLHANITRRNIDLTEILVGFRTSPHVDQRETGTRTAELLMRQLAGGIRPTLAYTKIPMVTPASTHIHFLPGPFQRLMEATREMERRGALAATAFTVQPWLDIAEMGFAMAVVTNNDPERAQHMADELAECAWAERHAFMETELVPPPEAIQRALAYTEGPVVLSDLADGTGAGSPGDATAVIAALLEAKPHKPAFVTVCDPEAAEAAQRAGVGAEFAGAVGGKRDNIYNHPVWVQGTVRLAQASEFRFGGEGYTGMVMDMGTSAVIQQGQVFLLITSKPVFTVDPALYRAVGLEPAEAQIVVVKSHIQFRAGYAGLAKKILLLDSPGMSSDHLTSLDFRRIPRPLFPFDPDLEWSAEAKR